MAGKKAPRAFSMEELPAHLIEEVLTSGRLTAGDLARLEAMCRTLRALLEHAASRLCTRFLERCGGSWKKVLRFLQSVDQSYGTIETSSGEVRILPSLIR